MISPIDLTIVGLGPAGLSLLTAEARQALEAAPRLLLRTERHRAAEELRERGVAFETLDPIYNSSPSFEGLYGRLAEAVRERVEAGPLVYAVPGHPLLGEESVRLLLAHARAAGTRVRVVAALSFVDVVAPALAEAGETPDLTQWQVADGAALDRVWWDPSQPTLIFQVDDPDVASRVKLALLEEYPDDFETLIVRAAGDPDRERVMRLPLFQLDRPEAGRYDHLTTVYLPPLPADRRRAAFADLVRVVAKLRSPEGCPWDREQTYQSLRRFVIEEAYEVVEAIDHDEPDQLAEELGDLLLQAVLLAQLGSEDGYFDIRDSIASIVEKMIRRHPHVFGQLSAENSEEVRTYWEAIKREEKPERESVLDGVPKDLPALMKALKVSKRVVRVGFEWPDLPAVLAKLDEEVAELKAELADRDPDRLRAELGDLLFTVVNVARWLKVDPEEALREMIDRFSRRFREVERLAVSSGKPLEELGIEELERLWQQAKSLSG